MAKSSFDVYDRLALSIRYLEHPAVSRAAAGDFTRPLTPVIDDVSFATRFFALRDRLTGELFVRSTKFPVTRQDVKRILCVPNQLKLLAMCPSEEDAQERIDNERMMRIVDNNAASSERLFHPNYLARTANSHHGSAPVLVAIENHNTVSETDDDDDTPPAIAFALWTNAMLTTHSIVVWSLTVWLSARELGEARFNSVRLATEQEIWERRAVCLTRDRKKFSPGCEKLVSWLCKNLCQPSREINFRRGHSAMTDTLTRAPYSFNPDAMTNLLIDLMELVNSKNSSSLVAADVCHNVVSLLNEAEPRHPYYSPSFFSGFSSSATKKDGADKKSDARKRVRTADDDDDSDMPASLPLDYDE